MIKMLYSIVIILIVIMIIVNENNAEDISMSRLPSFANDNTELFIAAVIEREFSSTILYLDTILMGHKSLSHMPQLPILGINNILLISIVIIPILILILILILTIAMNKSTNTISHWKDAALKWNPDRELNLTYSGYLCKILLLHY